MKVTDIKDLICGDLEGYREVTSEIMEDQSRWSISYSQVFQKLDDGTFWEATWDRGATEYQDNGLENCEVAQVWPHEVTKTVYLREPPKEEGSA